MPEDRDMTIEAALRRLVAEIAAGEYRDPLGQRLTLNTAYMEAATLLELRDLLGSGTRRGDKD